MKKRTAKQLEKVIQKAREELYEIEKKQTQKRNAALVGKCFKFLNSYGGGNDEWWTHEKVLGAEGMMLLVFRFETDCYGKISIEPYDQTSVVPYADNGYIEITPDQFHAEWQKLLAGLNQL